MRLTLRGRRRFGSDRVTPLASVVRADRSTARSSRSTASAMRAETMPMPNWLASLPSMIVMLA